MTIVFISNFLNHHQKPWIDALMMKDDIDFFFISMQSVPQIFLKSGYSNYDNESFNIPYYKGEEYVAKTNQLVINADVMIMGGTYNEKLINLRLSTKKLMLFYSERWHRRLRSYLVQPLRLINGYTYRRFIRFNKENCYMLCSGGYVPNDCRFNFSFKNKTFKWGYFPPFTPFDIDAVIEERKKRNFVELLWVARFLELKHPELIVKSVEHLLEQGYKIHLSMIGGIFKEDSKSERTYNRIKKYINDHHLNENITLDGVLPHHEVQRRMRNSDIFVFTSDKHEGWGAVLNEAMSNGVVPIASHKIGSTPYLIRNKYNGFIFESCNLKSLEKRIKYLLDNTSERLLMSKNAYLTIRDNWSPQCAANNLCQLCKDLLRGESTSIPEGPCSKAFPINSKDLL